MDKKYTRNITDRYRLYIVIAHDLIMIVLAWFLAYALRHYLNNISFRHIHPANKVFPVVFVSQVLCAWYFGLYRGVWRFASLPDLVRIIKSIVVGSLIAFVALFLINRLEGIPRSIFILYPFLLLFLWAGPRLFYRWLKDYGFLQTSDNRVLVIGAGRAGESFIRDVQRNRHDYRVVGVVDDNPKSKGQEIHGIRILGRCVDIPKLAAKLNVNLLVIAIPSLRAKRLRRIIALCEQTNSVIRTLPGITDIASGKVSISSLREVSLEDLLGREEVSLDWRQIKSELQNKVALVTGAAGSIGSELCRQLLRIKPSKLICVDSSEYHLYQIEQEFSKEFPGVEINFSLIDIADTNAINAIMQKNQPEIVFHAAAYKHVPMLEYQVGSAVRNNILGTYRVATAAIAANVSKFVLISTDKAVRPTNVMGASKRTAEMICQGLNDTSTTKFITVRFGNVLGSRGSVIPVFKKQLEAGGPLTVTHPDIERYFMTIPEASRLILQAASQGKGGEIFVLDMGKPIKIKYVAEQMIQLSGKSLDEIEIKYTGLRPGEKLFEELFYENEAHAKTKHKKIYEAQSKKSLGDKEVQALIVQFEQAFLNMNEQQLLKLISQNISEYKNETIGLPYE